MTNTPPPSDPSVLSRCGPLVGMIHVLPTPSSPGYPGMDALRSAALRDAEVLLESGFKCVLLENMHDFPPLREAHMGPETAASLATVAGDVRRVVGPEVGVGIQVLFGAHRVAVAVAEAAGLDFVRVEAWTYGHLSDKGAIEASAATTVRYAKSIGANDLEFWADAKKKHASHAATADLELGDVVAGLELHGAHAAIVTGTSTGEPPTVADLETARAHTSLPVVLGSGLSVQNAPELATAADGFIVGSSIKVDGDWRNPVDEDRARQLVRSVQERR